MKRCKEKQQKICQHYVNLELTLKTALYNTSFLQQPLNEIPIFALISFLTSHALFLCFTFTHQHITIYSKNVVQDIYKI